MNDKTLGAYTRHEKHAPTYWKSVVREYKDALEKAVRERDEALADAESRPLTPDDITDEMVERARNAPSFDGRLSPTPRLVREMLTAALTEPPARPEGAEDIERLLMDADREGGEAYRANGYAGLADYLASKGVRATGGN